MSQLSISNLTVKGSDILKLFFIMLTGRQKSPNAGEKQLLHKQSTTGGLRKTSFRFREVKPVHLPSPPPRNASKASPRNFTDFYSQQQMVLERLKARDKKMSSTASSFYTGPARNRLSSIDQGDNSTMRRTFFKPQSPSFGRTSLSFKRQNALNNEDNNNYLNKYQIVKQLGKGSFSTVFLAKKMQKKPISRSPSPLKERELEQSPEGKKEGQDIESINQLILKKQQSFNVQSMENIEEKPNQAPETAQEPKPTENEVQDLVAIKVYQKFKMNKDPHKFKNIRKEINIMQNLHHSSVLKMFQSVETLTKISLVVQFAGYQSLLQYVKHNYPLPLSKVRDISAQLVEALVYIHERSIVHRDIKLQNVLIHNDKVKLIDFGFSCLTHKHQKLTVICGTPNYMAPEVISRKEYEGEQADVWSYGVVVYALAQGRHPFKAETYNELERLVSRGKIQFKKVKDQQYIDFVRKILRVKPSERPTAREIQQMKWLQTPEN